MTIDLLIPHGLNKNGDIIDASLASKEEIYTCPECKEELILKQGNVRVHHFAHHPGYMCDYAEHCRESESHKKAKRLIVNAINDWKIGKVKRIVIARACPDCGKVITQNLPSKVCKAVEEYRVNGYVADIMLLGYSAEPLAVIEILYSHKTTEEKVSKIGLPLIELKSYEIEKQPYSWRPIKDTFNSFYCAHEVSKPKPFTPTFQPPASIRSNSRCFECKNGNPHTICVLRGQPWC